MPPLPACEASNCSNFEKPSQLRKPGNVPLAALAGYGTLLVANYWHSSSSSSCLRELLSIDTELKPPSCRLLVLWFCIQLALPGLLLVHQEKMQWPCDGSKIAKKVKNPNYGVRGHDGQAENLDCPACGYSFSNDNEWPGLPAGVKFDPSDEELLAHLAAKVDPDAAKAHPFINEFIPTLNGEDGICYTHPENISGVRNDGSSAHFFHRPAKAYTTGTRKRRKIQSGHEIGNGLEMRWHKTGKTRSVTKKTGEKIGWKKIMVLYITSGKKAKPDKTNWVIHQYHLGKQEEEKEGEFVVSKVFCQLQPRQCGLGRKEDDDDSEHLAMEMAEQQSYSHHHSSPSTFSNSNNILAAPPPPQTPGPCQRQAVKQHKGLLATITEDVERLQASLSGYSHNTNQNSDQSYLAMGYESTLSCKSASKIQGLVNYSAQCSPELGEKDTCCSEDKREFGKELQLDQFHGAVNNPTELSIVCSRSDAPSIARKQMLDTFDSEVLKFLSSENLDITLRLQRSSDVENVKGVDHAGCDREVGLQRSLGAIDNGGKDQGSCRREGRDPEKDGHKVDFGLENIVLDTPPDFLLESFLNSQESTDWLGKKKFWSDSSQKTEDGSFFDFLRDSQTSV
ncbi:hypothetical protein GOP47_0005472 [Adiantum capillus-veneris]|uniref:NAC domain-containing protein n=1 Tax=Adiantum capillus-veneris TaxID=13818 RepID=A0A9D4V5E8_ADICA|nr:hypothetical protein GOP47_0005472 [Adiantum capillus-veneris]